MKPGLRVLAVTVFCVLVEHDEVVEQSHRRARWDGIGFLVHRQARRGVEGVHAQYAAQLLRAGWRAEGSSVGGVIRLPAR